MERFYGFDLGDAESAIARTQQDTVPRDPEILQVCDAQSFITAYARLLDGRLLIGESACYNAEATLRRVRFKSRFLTDAESVKDIRTFAAGVLAELIGSGQLVQGGENIFYIGCPAGWKTADRERYREIFEQTGYPPVRIVSESRAALISACLSRHLQVGYDILSKSVLVVDVGSSTTDFAFIESGREVELQTAGEVMLGGGITDEMLLKESVLASPDSARIREVLQQSEAWKNYCEFAARRLKEKYFSDEDYWASRSLTKSIEILHARTGKGGAAKPLVLTLRMDAAMAKRLMEAPAPGLDGKSFREAFCDSLRQVREKIHTPELLFLTGGVSKLPAIRTWCQEAFPEAVVVTTSQPEFSVAGGLSHCGRIDEDMKQFRREVDDLIETSTVERIVSSHMEELYRSVVDTLTEPILETAAMNVFDRWRSGEISRLSEIDEELRSEIEHYLRSEEAQKLLGGVVSSWLRQAAYELEEYTMPICVRHNVPYRALNLTSYLSLSDIEGNNQLFDRTVVDVEQKMAEYAAETRLQLHEGVLLKVVDPIGGMRARLDEKLLRVIVMHLLDNAREYTTEGTITLTYYAKQDGIFVEVKDTGRGLPENLKENIFALLSDKNTYLQEETPGLGLSICKAIIDKGGGQMGARDNEEDGRGTVVWFWVN